MPHKSPYMSGRDPRAWAEFPPRSPHVGGRGPCAWAEFPLLSQENYQPTELKVEQLGLKSLPQWDACICKHWLSSLGHNIAPYKFFFLIPLIVSITAARFCCYSAQHHFTHFKNKQASAPMKCM